MDRRQFILSGLSAGVLPRLGFATNDSRLLATWQMPQSNNYQAGFVSVQAHQGQVASQLAVLTSIDLPTRAHGLLRLSSDRFLVLARRPGDWMMVLNTNAEQQLRVWLPQDTLLNGHAVLNASGNQVFTTETQLDLNFVSGEGAVSQRDSVSLEKLDEWKTDGQDPHELLFLRKGQLGCQHDSLLIANGGIPINADTGRAKVDMLHMDSSVVLMNAKTGEITQKWTLVDSRLSLRHMAYNPKTDQVGIALQAEHDDLAQRSIAPVFAILSVENGLQLVSDLNHQKGYAGSVVTWHQGFVVTCPRSSQVVFIHRTGQVDHLVNAQAACALSSHLGVLEIGSNALLNGQVGALDNHWIAI